MCNGNQLIRICFLWIIYNLSNTQLRNRYVYKWVSMNKLPLLLKYYAHGWMDEWRGGWRNGDINNQDKKKIYSWNEQGFFWESNFIILRTSSEVKWSEVAQSCPTLCDPMDCSLPGSSVHGIFQAIVLEWIAISFSRGSSQPRGQTRVSRIVDWRFTIWATREV